MLRACGTRAHARGGRLCRRRAPWPTTGHRHGRGMRRLVTRKMPCLGFPNRFSHGVGLQRRPQQPPQKTHTLTTTRATTSAASLSRRWCTIRLFTVKRRIYREPRRHFGVDGLCQLCREEEDGRWPPQRRSVHRHRRVRTPLIVDTVCAAFFGRRRLLQAGTPCPPDILPSPRHALVCFDSDGDVFVFFFEATLWVSSVTYLATGHRSNPVRYIHSLSGTVVCPSGHRFASRSRENNGKKVSHQTNPE